MKLKSIILSTVLLMFLCSCDLNNSDYSFTLNWNENNCTVYLNDIEIRGGNYSHKYGEPTTLKLEVIPNIDEGWYFSSYAFSDGVFPTESISEPLIYFEVDADHEFCDIEFKTFEISDEVFSHSDNSIKFKTQFPEVSPHYFRYDLDDQSISPLEINNIYTFYEDENTVYYNDGINSTSVYVLNESERLLENTTNDVYYILTDDDSLDTTLKIQQRTYNEELILEFPESFKVRGVRESSSGTKAVITGYKNNNAVEAYIYIWNFQENQLEKIDHNERLNYIKLENEHIYWSQSDEYIYFSTSKYTPSINPESYLVEIISYSLSDSSFTIENSREYEVDGHTLYEGVLFFENYYMFPNYDYVYIYNYSHELLFDFTNTEFKTMLGYNPDDNSAYFSIDGNIIRKTSQTRKRIIYFDDIKSAQFD